MQLKLPTPDSFPAFPFLPYEIQSNLMRHLYESLEESKVTIVESPTGTGKTLSLLCASLTWLRDEQDRARKGQLMSDSDSKEPEWVVAQTLDRKRRELEASDKEYTERLLKAKKKEEALRKAARARARKRFKGEKFKDEPKQDLNLDEATFLPDGNDDPQDEYEGLSPELRALMQKVRGPTQSRKEQKEEISCTKIYYASRTHSQLSQVLHELNKLHISLSPVVVHGTNDGDLEQNYSKLGMKRPNPENECHDAEEWTPDTRTVSLGSRKQLCINEKLKAKAVDLDEACRQRLSEKGERRCPYLPPPSAEGTDEVKMLDFRDQILATPKDIEDLYSAGIDSATCPYFGSRKAISQAQLVLLPYNLLLQKSARESLGIDLTNQVVIIDEAHNLIPSLLSLSTTTLPFRTLVTSLTQLKIYHDKFKNRLSTENGLNVKRLIAWLQQLQTVVEAWKVEKTGPTENSQVSSKSGKEKQATAPPNPKYNSKVKEEVEVMTSSQLLNRMGQNVEGINLLEINAYLKKSKIARKISGYCVKEMEKAAGSDPIKLNKLNKLTQTTPPLHIVESFIIALTAKSDDGRVTFTMTSSGQVELKYQHLNPSTYFQDIIDVARSVVLAGGTMSPLSDVINQLFSNMVESQPTRLTTFSCGHIVPEKNLQTLIVSKGPRGTALEFTFGKRSDTAQITDLGQIIVNFANMVPGGMVVFFPSYSFLNSILSAWSTPPQSTTNGTGTSVMDRLKAKKRIFTEPQEASEVETVLKEYAKEIENSISASSASRGKASGGALLFAVIGAKLSEGLNFSDDLARAVIIVGLPFANLGSVDLKERMAYVRRMDEQRRAQNAPSWSADHNRGGAGVKDAGMELYENMCMNSVNQSIGRAIRHRADWSSLVLIDARYTAARIRNKLPKWIGERVVVTETFGEVMKEMGRFYREKRTTGGM
ncbi:helicase C-terminal domain-containing protein [Abortiporus biennis]|nr:helicase C-terminal domain-containing protein [Abortiporus biennis]